MNLKELVRRLVADQGFELRKFPRSEFSPVPVFNLAIELLMAKRGPHLTFVQVGANDGATNDPIHGYITQHGWRGVLLEPQSGAFARLEKTYGDTGGRLILENLAISPDDSDLVLYRAPPHHNNGASFSVSAHRSVVAAQLRLDPDRLEKVSVPATTLDALLAKHGIVALDLLQIDAEGYDWKILSTLDLAVTRPAIIQFEHGHLSHEDCDRAVSHLANHGYRIYWGGYQADTLALEPTFFDS